MKEDIELIYINRDYSYSNPSHVLSSAIDKMKNEIHSVSKIDKLNEIIEFIEELILKNKTNTFLKDDFKRKIAYLINDDDLDLSLKNISNLVEKEYGEEYSFESNFSKIIYNIKLKFSYSPEVDDLAVVIDRDRGSSNDEVFIELIEKSKEENIDLYLTNPCIEFWFLLHLINNKNEIDDVIKHESKKTLDNSSKTINKLKQYYKKETKNKNTYQKNQSDFSLFFKSKNLNRAFVNAQLFDSNVKALVQKTGTNIHKLIKKMIKPSLYKD